jgi:hypothetical protein
MVVPQLIWLVLYKMMPPWTIPNEHPIVPWAMDDLFVAQLNGEDGNVYWIHQIGTPENERLAQGGGVDVDQFGKNAWGVGGVCVRRITCAGWS